MMTSTFGLAESFLTSRGVFADLLVRGTGTGLRGPSLFDEESLRVLTLLVSIGYVITVLFLEPFYVAAGFGMYLNRRAELEAWDIEQEFRRAFAS